LIVEEARPIADLYRKFMLVGGPQSTTPRCVTLLGVQYRMQSSNLINKIKTNCWNLMLIGSADLSNFETCCFALSDLSNLIG
jgi:hypothetical protein